jgi:hypothetical protein
LPLEAPPLWPPNREIIPFKVSMAPPFVPLPPPPPPPRGLNGDFLRSGSRTESRVEPPRGGLCVTPASIIAKEEEDEEEEDEFPPPMLTAALDADDGVIMQLLDNPPLPDAPDDRLNAPDNLSLKSFLTARLPKYRSKESDLSELCCWPPAPPPSSRESGS